MNKKISAYLIRKEIQNYTCLDNILSFYASNQFYNLLLNKNVSEIEFFPLISRNGNSIQIYFNYYNLSAILDFKEEYYEYCKYEPGCSAEELEKSVTREKYNKEFDIKEFVKNFIDSLDDDKRLIKSPNTNAKVKRKKKIYNLISIISMCIPALVFGPLAIYVLVSGREVELNEWFLLIIIIPLIIWFIFDVKSKRTK